MNLEPTDLLRAKQIAQGLHGKNAEVLALAHELCEAMGFKWADIRGPRKTQSLSEARQCLMWVLRHRAGVSYSEIGRMVNRDHSTVMHGIAAEAKRRMDLQE